MKKLFSNTEVWVALITLVVLLIGVFVPGYTLDIPHAAGLAAVSTAYIISLAIAPALFNWGSRKFWLTILTFLYIWLDSFHVFPAELDVVSLSYFVAAVAFYIIALAKDPGYGWAGLLVSRKFWSFIVSIVTIFLRAYNLVFPAGITPEQLTTILVMCFAVIFKAAFGATVEPLPDQDIPDDTGVALGAG